MFKTYLKNKIFFSFFLLGLAAISSVAQTTEFIYQGKLTESSLPASPSYDFEFRLFSVAMGGTALASLPRPGVAVSNGIFSVKLDFGSQFDGTARWLEIAVKPVGSANPLITLEPRQQITSAPYSIRSLNSAASDTSANSLQLGGVAANQYVVTTDTRLSDARNPLPGSANYIQNTAAPQAASNFNISGNGTAGGTFSANAVTAATQFNIASGARILTAIGGDTIVGIFAGNAATTGSNNSFFGNSAGLSNTTGGSNSFFGAEAGRKNTGGVQNSFFGRFAGFENTTGFGNSFFGASAGKNNVASSNSFFGANSGRDNSTGDGNAFFGSETGEKNTTGSSNTFFGAFAGSNNTTAGSNSFFGRNAGFSNASGANNSFFGALAGQFSIASNNSFFGKDAGSATTVGADNSFFGAFAGELNTAGFENAFFGTQAGQLNSTGNRNSFFGFTAGRSNNSGVNNSFFGYGAGFDNTSGGGNSFFGVNAGANNSNGISNVFVGTSAGTTNVSGNNNTLIGASANVSSGNLSFATAIGAGTTVSVSNTIQLGRLAGTENVLIPGKLLVLTLGNSGGSSLCLNSNQELSSCSSSLRYKTDIQPFKSGLNLVNRLQPITFRWREGNALDLGLSAEQVAQTEPLLVTFNKNGQVEGVKYDRVALVLLNAVKEQQNRLEEQQEQIRRQQIVIDGLKKLVCAQNPKSEICGEPPK